jgi:hypothetical protein
MPFIDTHTRGQNGYQGIGARVWAGFTAVVSNGAWRVATQARAVGTGHATRQFGAKRRTWTCARLSDQWEGALVAVRTWCRWNSGRALLDLGGRSRGLGKKRMGRWPVGQRGHMGSSGLTGRNGLTGLAREEIKDLIFPKKDFYLTQNSKEIWKKILRCFRKI